MYFSPSCPQVICNSISNQLSLTQTLILGNYLGFPLLSRKSIHSDFNFIIKKISNKLSNWKSKLFNIAGHVTLAKLVLFSIPIHLMQ